MRVLIEYDLANAECRSRLFPVTLNPLVFLRFPAPLSLPLRFDHHSSMGAWGWTSVFTIATDISVECRTVYLILLKSHDVLVELFPALRINRFVKRFRIAEIGSVKLKVGRIINQKFFGRNGFNTFASFAHSSQASTIHNNKPAPFIANARFLKPCYLASRALDCVWARFSKPARGVPKTLYFFTTIRWISHGYHLFLIVAWQLSLDVRLGDTFVQHRYTSPVFC
jgi:hypothetical protein